MRRFTVPAVAMAAVISMAALGALAHGDATGVVKERMEVMKTVGKAMKSLTAMMRGKQTYDAEQIRALARAIAEHGGDTMTKHFPEGSLDKPTEALPAIWTDWERFSSLAAQVTDYARALEAAADNDRGQHGGGMMGGGSMMASADMMRGSAMMSSGGMMHGQAGPDPEHLAQMPPDAAFMHLAQTCSACHESFRKEK